MMMMMKMGTKHDRKETRGGLFDEMHEISS